MKGQFVWTLKLIGLHVGSQNWHEGSALQLFCFMMSWTTRRIQFDFVLSPLTKLSPGRPREPLAIEFHNSSVPSVEVVRNIGPVSSVIIWMRTFCLWVLHPGSLTHTKNALQTIELQEWYYENRSRTRYLDLFCLFINSSIHTANYDASPFTLLDLSTWRT